MAEVSTGSTGEQVDGSRVVRKVVRRLLPLMVALYIIAYFDRINISFAALTMNEDLGISPYVYGWIAGIFFLGYFVFEVPSNLILERVGARYWISRIILTFSLFALGCAFANGPVMLGILRFLLGVAEAGFFPGMIIYLTYWFPAAYRGRVLAGFIVAIPLASVIGSPLATLIMQMDGLLGVAGWRWLFVVQALPGLVLGLVSLRYLTSKPAEGAWLSRAERDWLEGELARERRAVEADGKPKVWQGLVHPRVLALVLVQTCAVTANYGLTLWLPQLIERLTASQLAIGFIAALPFLAGSVGIVMFGRRSDRTGNRCRYVVAADLLIAAGFVLTVLAGPSLWSLVGLCIAAVGLFGGQPAMFTLPSTFLTGGATAAAVALITSVSNLGGFAGPYLVGWVRETTGSFTPALLTLAAIALVGAAVMAFGVAPKYRVRNVTGADQQLPVTGE